MILRKVTDLIDRQNLIPDNAVVLAAVSGGVDSVVLLHVLRQLSGPRHWKLIVGHVNHSLREAESDGDELFVRDLSERFALPFLSEKIDPAIWKSPGNKQAKARDYRYRIFKQWAKDSGCQIVATGHQADDQAETILERLARGAGIDGLSGIASKNGVFVRPLLEISRPEILEYAESQGLKWREDSSNHDSSYRRNYIRQEILPNLERLVSGATIHISEAASRLREAREALEYSARTILEQCSRQTEPGVLELEVKLFKDLPYGMRTAIYREVIRRMIGRDPFGFNAKHFSDMDRAALAPHRVQNLALPSGIHLNGGSGSLTFSLSRVRPEEDFDFPLTLPGITFLPDASLVARHLEKGELPKSFTEEEVFLDPKQLKGELTVRNRRRGDRIRLPNLGEKTVARVMTDAKIPHIERNRIPLVVDGETILWIAGLRRSDHARLRTSTSSAIGIKYVNGRAKQLDY